MKRKIIKRLLSILLTVVMLFGVLSAIPLTAHAAWEDGMECWFCNHYHWDEYCCGMCGACSEECTNGGCYLSTHCSECGACDKLADDCPVCLSCEDCYVNNGWHCLGCNECHYVSEEELCGYCWFCADCMGGLCDGCGFCEGCWELELMHCEECGNCYGSYDICQFGNLHCEECCVICEQCEECLFEDGIDLCDDCGLCVFCCQDNAAAEGCSCGEYCIENPDWYDHLCPDCGNAACEVDFCDDCELCLDCCEGNSDCSETPPVCVENEDYDFHFCEDCGECFHNSDICADCELAGLLLCETCCKIRLEEEGCDCSDRCISDSDLDAHIASAHKNATGSHTATPQNSWEISETHHWRACRYCDAVNHISNKAAHTFDKYGVCTVCRFDTQKNILILKQPTSVVAKVTHDSDDLSDPLHPKNNTRTFTVAARGTSALKYQWYYQYGASQWKALNDSAKDDLYICLGSKTNTLTITIPEDSCYSDYAYKCVITDTKGNQMTSNVAYLKSQHVRTYFTYYKGTLIDTIHTSNGNIGVYSSDGHIAQCVGDGCDNEKLIPHSFSKQTTLIVDRVNGVKWVERICTDCGYKGYILDHEHYFYDPNTYECEVDTSYKNDNQHKLKCLWPGCNKTTTEAHDKLGWQFHGTPYSNPDKVGVPYQECQICGYSVEKALQTYDEKTDKMVNTKWTQSNDLVFVEGGYASCDVVVNGTKLVIGFAPSAYYKQEMLKRKNPKITGWKVKYRCDRTPTGSVYEADVTKDFTFTKVGDELKWTVTVPLFTGRKGGGVLTFIPIIAEGECKHTGKTRIKGAVQPICTYDGYTGDTVCSDCEGVIKYGEVIESVGKHEGKLTLIPGTSKKGTCEQRGYEGSFRCDHCNKTVRGKSTSKVHNGKTVTKNAVAVTCTKFGYSGDIYCECGVLLQEGELLPPRHTNLKLLNQKKASCMQKGYTGDWKCFDCNQIVKYGYNIAKGEHAWSKWGKTDDVYHRHTCVVAGCGAAEKAKHTDANRDLVCDGCGYAWGSEFTYVIRSIAFNIDVPKIGAKPDYTKFSSEYYYSDGVSANKKNGVQWFDVTDNNKFVPGGVNQEYKEGHVYKVSIDFRATPDFIFADQNAIYATINGREAVVEYVEYEQFVGISYTFEALKHEHNMTRVNKVSPSCTSAGKQTYYHCDSCNKYYEDAAAKKQITDIKSWGIVPALGHVESEILSNSTHHFKKCTRCYDEISGSKAAHSGGTATCLKKAECATCGKEYGSYAAHDFETEAWRYMDAAGHAHVCRVEGCNYRSDILPHKSNGANTEEADELCVDCGYVISLSKNHVHKSLNGWHHDKDTHWGVCGCGFVLDKAEHVNNDGDNKCDVCGRQISEAVNNGNGERIYIFWIIIIAVLVCAATAVTTYFLLLKKKKKVTPQDAPNTDEAGEAVENAAENTDRNEE